MDFNRVLACLILIIIFIVFVKCVFHFLDLSLLLFDKYS